MSESICVILSRPADGTLYCSPSKGYSGYIDAANSPSPGLLPWPRVLHCGYGSLLSSLPTSKVALAGATDRLLFTPAEPFSSDSIGGELVKSLNCFVGIWWGNRWESLQAGAEVREEG